MNKKKCTARAACVRNWQVCVVSALAWLSELDHSFRHIKSGEFEEQSQESNTTVGDGE